MFLNRLAYVVGAAALGFFSNYASPVMAQQDFLELSHVSKDDSSNTYNDTRPRVAVDELGNAVSVWLRAPVGSSSANADQVMVSSSFDGGTTFGLPSSLSGIHSGLIVAADVVYSGNNNWLCIWVKATATPGVREVYVQRSSNIGLTWSAAEAVYAGTLGDEVDADASTSGTIIATFDTRLLRSTDGGATWEPMTAAIPVVPAFPTSAVGVLEARIATNGSGTWVHAYSSYWGTFDRFAEIHGHVSTDNGETWTPTLFESWLSQQNAVLGDVEIVDSTAVVAYRYFHITSVRVSTNGGLQWGARATVHEPVYSNYSTAMSLEMSSGQWMLISRNIETARLQYHVASDPNFWSQPQFVTGDTATEFEAAMADLPGGNVLALLQTNRTPDGSAGVDSEIYASVRDMGGVLPVPGPGPDLVVTSLKDPVAKTKSLKPTKVQWQVGITNVGEQASDVAVVRFYLSENAGLGNEDVLIGEKVIKPLDAPRPGKKLKTRKVKVKGEGAYPYIIAEIVSPGEAASENNIVVAPF